MTAPNTTPSTGAKINPFAKAKGKTAEITPSKSKKETVWSISPMVTADAPTREQLNEAVTLVHQYHAEGKALETKEKLVKGLLKAYAEEQYARDLAKLGVEPPTPLKVANERGQTVTFVVQDRGHLTKVGDAQYEALQDLVGADNMDKIIYEGGDFKFDVGTMSQDAPGGGTVQDNLAEAMGGMLAALVEGGKITQEQADSLLVFTAERRFKPGALTSRAIEVCGKNPAKLSAYFDLAGSGVTRYVKA